LPEINVIKTSRTLGGGEKKGSGKSEKKGNNVPGISTGKAPDMEVWNRRQADVKTVKSRLKPQREREKGRQRRRKGYRGARKEGSGVGGTSY